MGVNEVQGALGHPLSFSVQGMCALMRGGESTKNKDAEGHRRLGEDQSGREQPPPPRLARAPAAPEGSPSSGALRESHQGWPWCTPAHPSFVYSIGSIPWTF